MIKIKNHKEEVEFDSISSLITALKNDYRSTHLTIIYKSKTSGLDRIVFVSVDNNGSVFQSYGDQSLVDFKKIESEI